MLSLKANIVSKGLLRRCQAKRLVGRGLSTTTPLSGCRAPLVPAKEKKIDLSNLMRPCSAKQQDLVEYLSVWKPMPPKEPEPDQFPERADEKNICWSNKERVYRRTWIECPNIKINEMPKCNLENAIPPPFHKRDKQERICSQMCIDFGVKCPKVPIPGCRVGRQGRCGARNRPMGTCRMYPPYPSFSECDRDPIPPIKQSECTCRNEPVVKDDAMWRLRIQNLK